MNCNCSNSCGVRTPRRCVGCLSGVIGFLGLALLLVIGLAMGVAMYETLLPLQNTLIVFGVAIALILVALVIFNRCRND